MRSFLGLFFFLALTGCGATVPSYLVTFAVKEVGGGTPTIGGEVEGVTVSVMAQGGGESPADMTTSATSDANGKVGLRLPNSLVRIGFGKEDPDNTSGNPTAADFIGTTAWIIAGTADVDLSSGNTPIPLANGKGNNNYCRDTLNVTEGSRGGWIRVYKTSGVLEASDTLTITAGTNTEDVDSGNDLLDGTTADGTAQHLDIYDDSTTNADVATHKDAAPKVLDTDSMATLSATFNGTTMEFEFNPCSSGGMTVLYYN